jgi:hypothetical protein
MKHNNIQVPSGKLDENGQSMIDFNHKNTGRLSIIKDAECKMRVVAISDYYTQFTLRPIHKILMTLLSKLPCDRTFTQNPFHN